jgi:hypothetical protein
VRKLGAALSASCKLEELRVILLRFIALAGFRGGGRGTEPAPETIRFTLL